MNSFCKFGIGINFTNCRRLLFSNFICSCNYIYYEKFHQTVSVAAGHSKWANIRHIKAEKDGERASTFTRLTRQIRIAIQDGGSPNPSTNSVLKNAIEIALKKNMPMSTIQSTIKKIESSKNQIKEYQLEIKAFGKVYMVCVLYTDNYAMLKMNLAPTLKKAKASYVDARHLFEDIGVIQAIIPADLRSRENIEELCTDEAIDVGAEEIEILDQEKGLINFLCAPIDLRRISKKLSEKGYHVENVEHVFLPQNTVTISSGDLKSYKILKEKILATEGLERIYDNLDVNSER